MSRRLKQAAVVLVLLFVAAQFVRPERVNPPTDPGRTIAAHLGSSSGLVTVLDRTCSDCHSNRTVWPWYTQLAPVSWLMASAVHEGRKAVNFSDWAAYSPEQQRMLLTISCSDVSLTAACLECGRCCTPKRGFRARISRSCAPRRARRAHLRRECLDDDATGGA